MPGMGGPLMTRQMGGQQSPGGGMGAPRPMGGQAQPQQTGGGGMTEMLGGMYGGFGGPHGANRGAYTYGMGPAPGQMSPRMVDLQRRCSAGDGRACNELQIATSQHQETIANYYQGLDAARQRSQGGGNMGARSGY